MKRQYVSPKELKRSGQGIVDLALFNKTEEVVFASTKGSEVVDFFKGKSVFLTGATGFLGQLIVEKLLRTCPDIEGIYVLVRNKKGKKTEQRVEELLDGVVFSHLPKICPKYKEKVITIEGDVSLPELGISKTDRNRLINKINVIFHVAATVRFNEELSQAVKINVLGTKYVLDLGKECAGLESFVHVSTAYTQCIRSYIEESIYSTTYSPDELIERMNDVDFNQKTKSYLGGWPNTYSYTKAVAEVLVKNYGEGLPISIIRPGVVTSTYKEPIKCWINNLYGPMGAIVGIATGLIRSFPVDREKRCEIVPADYVVNAVICCAYANKKCSTDQLQIYNYVSSTENPITWGDFEQLAKYYGLQTPSSRAIWYYCVTLTKYAYLNLFLNIFLHFIPAIFIDVFLLATGRKPRMFNIYKKIYVFGSLLSFFSTKEWDFENGNIRSLWSNLSDVDKKLFSFSLSPDNFNWNHYMEPLCMGVRMYLLNEDFSTVPEAIKKKQRLYYYHQLLKMVFYAVLLKLSYEFICRLL